MNTKQKKTLIFHMSDPTTDFLAAIYDEIQDITLIRHSVDSDEVDRLIASHDRILMLGHGLSQGLFGDPENSIDFIINSSHAEALRYKENIFIWCYASQFVEEHNLSGFSTSMFISETSEAEMNAITSDEFDIERSNRLFAKVVGEGVKADLPLKALYQRVLACYHAPAGTECPVINFNHAGLRLN